MAACRIIPSTDHFLCSREKKFSTLFAQDKTDSILLNCKILVTDIIKPDRFLQFPIELYEYCQNLELSPILKNVTYSDDSAVAAAFVSKNISMVI